MDPSEHAPLAFARIGRRLPSGTVALIDRASIAIAQLSVGPRGTRVHRHVMAFNGQSGMQYLESDPASVAAALARVLKEQGFAPRLVCLGLFESMFGATLCDLPTTTTAAATALLERRVREQVIDQSEDILADHACIDATARSSDTPRRALLAWSARAQLQAYADAFRKEQLHVERVVPPFVALLDLFGRTRPDDGDRLELFARYCFPSVIIGVNRGRQPLYLRFLPDVMADATDGVVPTLLNEVRRTAAFAVENQHGTALSGVVYSGLSPADASRFVQRLREEARLPAQAQTVTLDGSAQGADPERLAALTGLLLHGAPLARQRVRAMNLLPARVRSLSQTMITLLVFTTVSTIAAFTSLGLARHALAAETDRIGTLESRLADLSRHSEERLALVTESRRSQAAQATLELLGTVAGNPVQPLLEALLLLPAGTTPSEGRLDHAYAVGSEVPRLELQLRGDFTGEQAGRLAALVAALRQRPWCLELQEQRGSVEVNADRNGVAETVTLGMRLQ
jgi:hypothetical protein